MDSMFRCICNFINRHPIGYKFDIDYFKKECPDIKFYDVAFSYLDDFEIIGIIRNADCHISYEIISHIPNKFSYGILSIMLKQSIHNPPWKTWFIPFEERVNKIIYGGSGEEV